MFPASLKVLSGSGNIIVVSLTETEIITHIKKNNKQPNIVNTYLFIINFFTGCL